MVRFIARSCVRDSYGLDFTFYLDYFLFLSSLGIFTILNMLICSASVSNGPLAQLVERGAYNRKVLC